MDPFPADGRARKESAAFRQSCGVAVAIRAKPEKVWALLTDAPSFPKWNPTVERIDGRIALGEKLAIRVPAAPGRTFKPKVSELVPGERMTWSDGQMPFFAGDRTFTVKSKDGGAEFRMVEVFRGAMLPMIKGSLPDFGPIFEEYAASLKREAEKGG